MAGTSIAPLQRAVRNARGALRATRLDAPIAGTVAQLNGTVGDSTSSATAAFATVMDPRRYAMAVSIGENDIASIRQGQRATVTVDAVGDLDLAGHVTSVGLVPDSSESASTVTYPVTITLDAPTRPVRAGMTASARIVVRRAAGMSIPSAALSGSTVTVVHDGSRSTVRVQTGLAGDTRTIVTSGLARGDRVAVTSASAQAGAAARNTSTMSTGGGFGGFGGRQFGGPRRFGGGTLIRP